MVETLLPAVPAYGFFLLALKACFLPRARQRQSASHRAFLQHAPSPPGWLPEVPDSKDFLNS